MEATHRRQLAGWAERHAQPADSKAKKVDIVFTQLKANLDAALDGPGTVQLTFGQLDEQDTHEYERDRETWRARRDSLGEEKRRELDAIRRRYENVRELVFPFTIAPCVPDRGNQ